MFNKKIIKIFSKLNLYTFSHFNFINIYEKKISPDQEIGSELTITERNQFFSITQEQRNQIKSLRIENQSIDDEFEYDILKFNYSLDLEQLYFINCSFSSTNVLCEFYGKKVGFIRCSLSYDILEEILCTAAPYNDYDF